MASQTHTTVVAVEALDETIDRKDVPANGIISSQFILFTEMDDETLQILYEQSPELVMEKRPDWIKKHYPNTAN